MLSFSGLALSQSVSINTNGAPPNSSAGLEINIPNKGFLISRVLLTATINPAPLPVHVAGIIVFNTATVNNVSPGLYYNNGVRWIRINPPGTAPGNMLYWNGTSWVLLPPGTPGQRLMLNSSGLPVWN